jgi:uncharacterized protein YbjT (DUF2867 family)
MRILVTGASGFAGAMLAARLLADGHEVQALARTPARAHAAVAAALLREQPRGGSLEARERPSVIRGDVMEASAVGRALAGVEVAYYLVHSMERAADAARPTFAQREREAALRFGECAARAGVRRIVYLGGLVPREWQPSRHLASRLEVERLLLDALPDALALRSSIVIGARSRSFRLLVRLIERLPVLALPPWRRFRTQPIDSRDLLEMLVGAIDVDTGGERSLDIAGPEVVTYEALLERLAEIMVVRRPRVRLGWDAGGAAARVAAAIAGEDPELTSALMEGLAGDLLPRRPASHAASLFGVRLHGLDAALEHALRDWEAVEPLAAR